MAVCIHLKLVLVVTIGVLSVTAAPPQKSVSTSYSSSSSSSTLTAPAVLTPTSSENVRFSRLLKDNAEVLRFTSLSNAGSALALAISKESKEKLSNNAIPENTVKFGRRVLDYDDTEVDESSQKIITRPEPGNEYVYIQPPGISTAQERPDSEFGGEATLTGINKKPANHRIPVALLRQTNGNRVNINPVFPNVNYDEQPTGEIQTSFNQVVSESRSRANSNNAPVLQQEIANLEATTTIPHYYNEEYEATTPAALLVSEPEEITTTTVAHKIKRKKMVVNVVTSHPRVVFDNTTNAPLTTTTEAATTTPSTTTSTAPSTSTDAAVNPADEKENLLVQASTRSGKVFPDFDDTNTRLQTAESSQPARVNVRPASSGKDYEYEYIYYYYDDEDEDNSTKKAAAAAAATGETTTGGTTRLTTTLPTTTTTVTTTTTTPASPAYESYEDEEDEHVEEKPIAPKAAAPLKNSFSSAPAVPAKNQQFITEKVTASNPSNLLEKTRGQKTFPSAVAESSEYKLEQDIGKEDDEDDYEEHDEPKREILSSSLRGQSQAREVASDTPLDTTTISAARQATSGLYDNMPKLAKSHASSINTPIVLKQSTLIQRVPASQLFGNSEEDVPVVTTTTTTTTTTPEPEVSSRAPTKFRAHTTRVRGNGGSAPGNTISRAIPSTPVENTPVVEQTEAPVRHRLSPAFKESTRRVAARRPHVSETTPQVPVEAPQPQASPSITVHSEEGAPRSITNIRTRFPPRTTVASPVEPNPTELAPEVPYQSAEIASTAPGIDANSVSDKKAKENFVRNKSAKDLYAFTRLQEAIHSRTPSRSKELLTYNSKAKGGASSQELTTDVPDSSVSSEATTVSSYISGSSGESINVVTEQPSTTTTTTTTEAVQLDRFGKPKRFPGRTRRPNVGSATTTTTTTESSKSSAAASPSRFNGRRRKFGTSTSAPEASEGAQQAQSSSPTVSSEAPSRVPSRNRFANRNKGSTTTEASSDSQHKEENTSEQSTSAPQTSVRSRRPNHFQARKRLNKATTETEDEPSPATPTTNAPAAAAPSAAPAGERRTRPNYGNHGRNRPALTGGPGPRIRSQRLGGLTTTTTEAPAAAEQSVEAAADNQETAEQSPSQSEQTDAAAPAQTTTAAPEPPKRGSAGVLDGQSKREFAGRLRSRSKPVVTTTAAPEPVQVERKPSRVGGILNRRKQGGTSTTAAPVKEEVKDDAEEENNHAQEQVESQHKGVVVQISSTVSEGEEVQEKVEEEPSSTTQGSILNRLKGQRKPGSIYRKRPEPHGE